MKTKAIPGARALTNAIERIEELEAVTKRLVAASAALLAIIEFQAKENGDVECLSILQRLENELTKEIQ